MTPGATSDVVFLLDVDNTLLDNDRIIADLRHHLELGFGLACAERYWSIFETLRTELGYADYLGALQRYRLGADGGAPDEQRLLLMSSFPQMLDAMQRHYPARHYVMVDDKLRILAAMKKVLQQRLTTVFVRQGHYAFEPAHTAGYPAADMTVERIGDLADVDLQRWLRTPAPTANPIQEKR